MDSQLLLVFAMIALAAFIIGLSKGGLGGAMGSLVTPLLVMVMPAPLAVGLSLPMLLAGDVFAVAAHWRKWDWKLLVATIPATVVGVLLGSISLGWFASNRQNALTFQHILGGVALVYVAYALWRRRAGSLPKGTNVIQTNALAWATGFSSTLANAGGPVYTIHMLTLDLKPSVFVATTALYFFILNTIKLPSYFLNHLLTIESISIVAWALPLIPMGVWAGVKLDKVLDMKTFEAIILVFLAITGVILLLK